MLGVHSDEAAMIGDRMDTDIVAGIESGLTTVLVLSGVTDLEFLQLRRLLLAADPEVFIIIEENVFVVGNFQKRVNQ